MNVIHNDYMICKGNVALHGIVCVRYVVVVDRYDMIDDEWWMNEPYENTNM
jgi:hypothetical protein